MIDSAQALDAYTVRMDTAGLSASLDETGGVVLKDQEEKEVFRIAPPLLYDAADEISLDVGVSLEQSGDQCVIIYTPDRAWLEAPERQWPVVIDPTVTSVSIGQTSQVDNYVYNGQSSVVDGSSTTMYVGCYTRSGTKREHRTYWRLKTLPTIPSGGKISGASFHIRLTSGTSTMRPISLYKAASTWDSSTIRWSNKPLSSTYLGQQSSVPSGTEKWLTYGGSAVTSAVSSWYSSPGSNYGFVLQYDRCLDDYNVFYSSDYRPSGSLSYIPYVSINYIASAPVSQVCLSPTSLTLNVNQTAYLYGSATPWNAPQGIYYTSSNPSVASVGYTSGLVCAKGPGVITITARSSADSSKYATCTVTVNLTDEQLSEQIMLCFSLLTEYSSYAYLPPMQYAVVKDLDSEEAAIAEQTELLHSIQLLNYILLENKLVE